MKIEMAATSAVIPYARNPRKNEAAIAKVAASLKEFGWKQPIVVDKDRVIIAGHTRHAAALQLGISEIPIVVAEDLTPQQAKAYRLADNRTASEAEWDAELLKLELEDLVGDFDLSTTGFDAEELEQILSAVEGTAGLTDPDAAPDLPAEPRTQPGDLWVLGRHRLLCGDATNADAVARLNDGVTPTLMVTDPPYGVSYDPSFRSANTKKLGKVSNDHIVDWTPAWKLFRGSVAYVWHAGRHASEVQRSLESAAFTIRCQIIWAKDRFAMSRGNYHWQHEPCWYAVKEGANWQGSRTQSTLWNIPAREDKGHGHSTQKPVECMRRPIVNNSSPGQVIYDPFLGSGTTLIAAEMEGRICYAMEIEPGYVDVAVDRWEAFTGQKAQLADGREETKARPAA